MLTYAQQRMCIGTLSFSFQVVHVRQNTNTPQNREKQRKLTPKNQRNSAKGIKEDFFTYHISGPYMFKGDPSMSWFLINVGIIEANEMITPTMSQEVSTAV